MLSSIKKLIDSPKFQGFIIALIVLNGITLGLETDADIMAVAGNWIGVLDRIILAVFVIEILLRMAVYRWRFFLDPWSIFDFVVVTIALLPSGGAFAVLRALRVLRVLRLISVVPSMRSVVQALLASLPGLGAIVALLGLVFYVAAVMATKLFAATFPQWFGSIGESLYSLFQIMTLESWSMGIVRPVMEQHSWAWAFFVPFILIATFTMLNLFIAVVVNAMQNQHEAAQGLSDREALLVAHDEREHLAEEIRSLRNEMTAMMRQISNASIAANPGSQMQDEKAEQLARLSEQTSD